MYFLSNLIQDAQKHQTMFGDVPLSYAQVGHAKQAMVDHYDDDEGAEIADRRQEETGIPAEFALFQETMRDLMAIPIEERLKRCEPGGLIPISDAELTQLLEYRDELKDSYQTRPRLVPPPPMVLNPIAEVPPAGLIEAAAEQLGNMAVDATAAQEKELHVAMGDEAEAGKFRRGYNLGLQTARVCLATSPAMQLQISADLAKRTGTEALSDVLAEALADADHAQFPRADKLPEDEKAPPQVDALAMHEQHQADLAEQAAAREKAQAADEAGKQPETLQE